MIPSFKRSFYTYSLSNTSPKVPLTELKNSTFIDMVHKSIDQKEFLTMNVSQNTYFLLWIKAEQAIQKKGNSEVHGTMSQKNDIFFKASQGYAEQGRKKLLLNQLSAFFKFLMREAITALMETADELQSMGTMPK